MNGQHKKTSDHGSKYGSILKELNDEEVYTAVTIAYFARDRGLLDPNQGERDAMQRIRITLTRLADLHEFPVEGDRVILIRDKIPSPAWLGWRWKRISNDR